MKPNQEATQKNVDFIALINQEYSLVVDGKAADKLVRLLHDYETDPFAGRIEKAAGAVEKYAHALLINGQYLDIGFLFIRYSQLVIAEVKHFQTLMAISDAGKKEELTALWEQTQKYIAQLADKNLAKRIREATIDNTIAILSKYYLNFRVEDLRKIAGVTEKELVERGVELREGFIQLKEEVAPVDCLQSKLKELAVVASRMSQFE